MFGGGTRSGDMNGLPAIPVDDERQPASASAVTAHVAAKLGLKDTYLYKKVFTPAPAGVAMPADQKKFGLGKTTAREMAAVMSNTLRGSITR